jgi:hypothetical protein
MHAGSSVGAGIFGGFFFANPNAIMEISDRIRAYINSGYLLHINGSLLELRNAK